MIYDRALSDSEVVQNFESSRSKNIGLTGYTTSGLTLNLDAGNYASYPTTGTKWVDISGNYNNGTLTNGPVWSNTSGGTITFDGSDDYVGVPNGYTSVMKGNDYWTVSMWIKFNSFGCCGAVLISPGNGQLEYFDLFLQVTSNTVYFAAGGGASSNYLSGTMTTLTINTIYNVVFVKTGVNTGKFYINTNEISLSNFGTGLGAMPNVNADFKIGAFKQPSWEFNGNIFNTLMYNRALSASEILQNYNALKGRFGL
jgi:hypothetical protein